jgi:type I restriction enzyme R subunit
VIFVNGLPLGVIELKNPGDEGATIWDAVQQLENYQTLIPALFTYNAADRLGRRAGAYWRARRGQGMVQAVAHDRRA